jgi:2-oxoglutarate dehydrogenase E1 component
LKKIEPKESTKISEEILERIVQGITNITDDFTLNPKIKRNFDKRKTSLVDNTAIDWAFAESLAFGSLLLDGFPVRLSGQDSARGTFSQRHLILTDMNTGKEILPLNHLSESQARIEALDSLLSENAVLGFEYGYSAADPLALVLWEAQFGDFANGAQVIIDNFIAASEVKWHLPNNVVLLLPHGQEGQGPEHSSARLERFLILCAEENMIVANPTSPAQYFHLLRKQVLGRIDKPLIVFTPKSLLRLPSARSSKNEFTEGKFKQVIDDNTPDKQNIKRILLTSGKIYYELDEYRNKNKINDVAIMRIEQYYPFDTSGLKSILDSYPKVNKILWVQEEPQNMGAWNFIFNKISFTLPKYKLEYCGRDESPSPAYGSTKLFFKTQKEIIEKAFE